LNFACKVSDKKPIVAKPALAECRVNTVGCLGVTRDERVTEGNVVGLAIQNAVFLEDVKQAKRLFANKLRAAGVAVTEETFAGTIHGFLRALGHVAAADRAARQGGEWLKARFA